MKTILRRASRLGLVLVMAACARSVAAQDNPRAADVQLRAYAAAVVQIERIRDDVAATLALPENKTVERQAELRAEMRERIAQAIGSQGLTRELYDRLEHLVTTDEEWRDVFERHLATARRPTQRSQ